MFIFTIIIIVINILIFFLQQNVENSGLIFGLNMLFIENKFYWQPVTSMFMHANLTHLSMNMVVLFQLGSMLERAIGAGRFFIIYILGGILTSLLSFVFIYSFANNHTLVGASGAISVLFGYIAMRDKNLRWGLVIAMLLISFAPLLLGIPIAWYAHLIGFGLGWILAFIL